MAGNAVPRKGGILARQRLGVCSMLHTGNLDDV